MSHVLVVDDNPLDGKIAEALLQSINAQVELASDGFAALESLEKHKFDLLIVDLTMPNMSGLELVRRIKAVGEWSTIPIVILSGRNEESDVRLAIKKGAKDYITKPIDHEIFKKKVTKFIDAQGDTWTEYELPQTNPKSNEATLFLRSECQLKGLSEIGGSFWSGARLKKDYQLEIELPIFRGLPPTSIRIEECEPAEDRFLLKFAFVGITDQKRQKIRAYLTELWRLQQAETSDSASA